MHIEKNVCESVVGTLLHITRKTKDGINSRLDYVDMNIRLESQLVENDNGNTYVPTACYT